MLVEKLKSSLSLSFMDKYVGYTLRFISTIIIARLCTPHDIGLFSVAFVLISIGHVLRDFGVAQYLIQQPAIDKVKIRASLTMMWVIAWSLFAVLWMMKTPISEFYQEPELKVVIEVLSVIFLLAPFGSVRIALLRREMNFKTLAKINILSYFGLHISTLYLAFTGYGVLALVWGQVIGVIVTLLGTLYYSPANCFHWPSIKGIKDVYRFGLPLCLTNILDTTSENSADLILGKVMTMQAVGFFGKAQSLMNLFKIAVTSAVWPVVLPYFSMKNRQKENLLPDYLKAVNIYTMFAWPFFFGLWFFTDTFILLLFGEQWLPITPIVKILCLIALLQSVFPFYNALLVARGKVGLNLKCQIIFSFLRLLAVSIGVFYSLEAVAISLLIAETICFIVLYAILKNTFKMTLLNVKDALAAPLFSCTILSVCFAGLRWSLHDIEMAVLIRFFIPFLLGLVVWSLHLKYTNHIIYQHLGLVLGQSLRGKKRASY